MYDNSLYNGNEQHPFSRMTLFFNFGEDPETQLYLQMLRYTTKPLDTGGLLDGAG